MATAFLEQKDLATLRCNACRGILLFVLGLDFLLGLVFGGFDCLLVTIVLIVSLVEI